LYFAEKNCKQIFFFTTEAGYFKRACKFQHSAMDFTLDDRQEIYTKKDRHLLAKLIHELDPEKLLFSAKRDAGVSEKKRK
jgi:hypothetical protein